MMRSGTTALTEPVRPTTEPTLLTTNGARRTPPMSVTITTFSAAEEPRCPVCGSSLWQGLVDVMAHAVWRTELRHTPQGWRGVQALPDGGRHWFECGACGQRLPEAFWRAIMAA